MNDTRNLRLQIAELGEAILGDNLLGLQVGNEPDLYGRYVSTLMVPPLSSGVAFRHNAGGRPTNYSPQDYFNEFGTIMTAINNNPKIPVKNNIIGPSTSGSQWTLEDVFNTSYIQAYTQNLGAIAVEKWVKPPVSHHPGCY
jgi:hypothetical protein